MGFCISVQFSILDWALLSPAEPLSAADVPSFSRPFAFRTVSYVLTSVSSQLASFHLIARYMARVPSNPLQIPQKPNESYSNGILYILISNSISLEITFSCDENVCDGCRVEQQPNDHSQGERGGGGWVGFKIKRTMK